MSDDTHECEQCGMMCDCDGEDMHNPQPETCVHFRQGNCDADLDQADVDEDEPDMQDMHAPGGGLGGSD